MKNELKQLIGTLPSESGFKKRMRFHQGWWRAFVLAEKEGNHPVRKEKIVCNTILNGQTSGKNFLSPEIFKLEISWERRELSMLLWARYCGIQLSEEAFG